MGRWVDVAAVLVPPLAFFMIIFFIGLRINYIGALLLFFGIPCIYLSLRNPERIRKVATFTLLSTIPLYFIIDLLSYFDSSWIVPASVFPIRVLGTLPLEDILWLFLVTYLAIMLYENFCVGRFDGKISGRIKTMCLILYPLMLLLIALFYLYPSLEIPYAFDLIGVCLLLAPPVLFLLRYPSYSIGFLKVQLLFTLVHLPFELTGDKYGYWLYLGSHYLGMLHLLGVSMPIEEMVFVMVCGAFAACSYYVFFAGPLPRRSKAIWEARQ